MREPRAILDLADPIHFQKDLRASRVTNSTWPHQGNTVKVAVRGGQTHQPSQSWSINKNKRAKCRQESVLKTASAWRQKPQGTKSIEKHRWKLLKHWHSSSEATANWSQQGVRTDERGTNDGCTLE